MMGGMHERGYAWWGGHARPWGAWPGGMCGRGRVCVEGACMVGGVCGMGENMAGEMATAAGWYASYWNAFLFCRKLPENETIWTLRGICVPGIALDPAMLGVVGPPFDLRLTNGNGHVGKPLCEH